MEPKTLTPEIREKIWITRYWETEGIFSAIGHYGEHSRHNFYIVDEKGCVVRTIYMPAAFQTFEEAAKHVQQLAQRKTERLQAQIAHIRKWL